MVPLVTKYVIVWMFPFNTSMVLKSVTDGRLSLKLLTMTAFPTISHGDILLVDLVVQPRNRSSKYPELCPDRSLMFLPKISSSPKEIF